MFHTWFVRDITGKPKIAHIWLLRQLTPDEAMKRVRGACQQARICRHPHWMIERVCTWMHVMMPAVMLPCYALQGVPPPDKIHFEADKFGNDCKVWRRPATPCIQRPSVHPRSCNDVATIQLLRFGLLRR